MTDLVLSDRAALALIDEAEQALAAVDTATDADELWRKVKAVEEAARLARVSDVVVASMSRVRLRAKRRYGELLGPAERGGDRRSTESTSTVEVDRDYKGEHRARKLAAVPEPKFDAHLEQADPENLTEAAVLRIDSVHFSSETDEWATPQPLFDALNREFNFQLDVCALASSAKCSRFFTPEDDGLDKVWSGICWMNPPYGGTISDWMDKAKSSAEAGATVVCLVPSRTDTAWWWRTARFGEIRFLKGRLKFGNATNGAPFPSAVVVFSPNHPASTVWWEPRLEVFSDAA